MNQGANKYRMKDSPEVVNTVLDPFSLSHPDMSRRPIPVTKFQRTKPTEVHSTSEMRRGRGRSTRDPPGSRGAGGLGTQGGGASGSGSGLARPGGGRDLGEGGGAAPGGGARLGGGGELGEGGGASQSGGAGPGGVGDTGGQAN